MKAILLAMVGCLSLVMPVFANEAPTVQQDNFYKGNVKEVLEQYDVDDYGMLMQVQELRVQVKKEEKTDVHITHQVEQGQHAGIPLLAVGDRVVVGETTFETDNIHYISDMYRLRGLYWALALFLFLAVLFAGKYGARSVLGLAISFAVIMWYVVPKIMLGWNPLFVSLTGTIAIASTSLYVAHGYKARTTIAFISTVITILIAFVLALWVTNITHLFGIGTEEAFFLRYAPIENLNLRWLLLGGMVIGTLGVLDDVTTAQAAAVEEIHKANPSLGTKELYLRGTSVGKEHIVSLVNTLVLAYTGASLPLLLLFNIYPKPAWVILNSEIVMEEVARMIVGSIALILAVPLTTAIAAWHFGHGGDKQARKVDGSLGNMI